MVTPPTAYCPACWGTGRIYRIPATADSHAHGSCGCATPAVEDWESQECARCAGTGLVPAGTPAVDAG